ncbi:MAG: prepilin-type N-terminal cleavage/methylation domain-containing protein [Desulfuromusa sp.]|nr:prepilin-type N-terminal cleavage/methylation domain-containing protein [Desulfuromusa sp.]
MNAYKPRQNGFTLVELVVIILLLGILAAFAMPKLFNLSDYRTRAAYDEVAGAVRYAQKLAVASGCEVQVSISGNSYSLQQHSTNCTSGAFTTISNHPITSNTISGVSLTSSPSSFIFDAMGRSSGAVTVNIDSDSFTVIAETGTVDAQ